MQENNPLINTWINFSKYHNRISNALDHILQVNYQLCLNDFYILMFLYQAEDNKLRLSQLQKMVGLSQSALSRLVSRLEIHPFQAVKRATFKKDKRSVYAILTSSGEKHVIRMISEVNKTLEESLSKKDIQNLKLFTD
ncbi:MAG: MarR family transcriptional regulator [Sphingobacterium sp.]|nr:MarR family transcriptional regulator [Sphingobacterium sp.]